MRSRAPMAVDNEAKPDGPRRRNARGEGDRLRIDLIEAATDLLARLGPDDAVSLRAVAKQAGVAAPSVYRHFADLNVLLLAVLEKLLAERIARRQRVEDDVREGGGNAWDCLLALSREHVQFALQHTGHYKVLYEGRVVLRLENPKVATSGRLLRAQVMGLIREVCQEKFGQPPEDVERLALLLWSGLHGIVSLQINKPTFDWPDAAEMAEQMIRALIRP
jgi:AcrR family transcriptional regulator